MRGTRRWIMNRLGLNHMDIYNMIIDQYLKSDYLILKANYEGTTERAVAELIGKLANGIAGVIVENNERVEAQLKQVGITIPNLSS